MPDTVLVQSVSVPDKPVGMQLTEGMVYIYNSGSNLVIGAGTGGGGVFYGLNRYSMSTPYDLTTLSLLESIPFDAATTNYLFSKGLPNHFKWNNDGSKYFWGGTGGSGGKLISQVTV
jgi:hypothetical protein